MVQIESPGFCDLQVNGFAGVDFNQPDLSADDLHRAAAALRATGVTRFLPALITSSFEDFARCARVLRDFRDPAVSGIHMEGPYLSTTEARGVHPLEHLIPASVDDFERRQDAAGGRIVLVTLAPEVPGALELIDHLVRAGVRASLGHTDAPPERIRDAVSAGATLSTHLGNGCSPRMPRHPNHLWEQLAAEALLATFIADGHHLPAATLKSMVRAKTPDRSILVTDATAAAASPAGRYRLGRVVVERNADSRVTLPGTRKLAGSCLTLPDAVAQTVRCTGLPMESVLAMASTIPARYLGIAPHGRIRLDWDPETFALSVVGGP